MNYIVFDLAIAAVLLFSLWRGYTRGFILTFCGFAAIFVALIGASFLSDALAEPVSQAIRPVVEENIQQTFQDYVQQMGDDQAPADQPNLPLSEALEALKGSRWYQGFAEAIQDAVDQGVVEVTAGAAQAIASYVAIQIARIVLFAVAFVLILVGWFLLSHALDLAFKLPVLSTLNHWSGAALGLIKGAVLVFIAAWLLGDSLLPPEAVRNSYLLKFFCTTNPVALVLQILH